jgi:hypothetical protein
VKLMIAEEWSAVAVKTIRAVLTGARVVFSHEQLESALFVAANR